MSSDDTHDPRRASQLVRANQRLREMNRLKSEFLANVSHELKTPLTSVIGFASLLLRGSGGPLSDKGRHFAERIVANARTLHAAINDILDFAQLSTRQGQPDISTFHLAKLVDECVRDVRPALGDKPVELAVELPDGLAPLESDRGRLRQILMHFLTNAAKFTHRGSIRVSAELRDGEACPLVAIAVADTGIGMPPDALPHIFEEFRQVDGSSTRRHGGSGLGLSLVKHLCRLVHGEIEVESRPSRGSTFAVVVPVSLPTCLRRREALRQQVEAEEPDPSDRSTPIVLAVGDEPSFVAALREQLEPHGYRVASVFDRDEALSRAWAILPCAVVLDVMAPGAEVWELADVLRAEPRTTDVPLIVVSSLGGRDVAQAAGAADWLPRPVDPEALLNALEHLRAPQAGAVLAIVRDSARRDLARHALHDAGYQVTCCPTCADAAHFADSHFDVVVLDPEAEGEGVLNALGTVRSSLWADAPLVAWVGPACPTELAKQLDGVSAAVVRQSPDDPSELLDAVAQAIGKA